MEQLFLFSPPLTPYSLPNIKHDPYWDEITQEEEKTVGGQLPSSNTVGEQVQTYTQKVAPQQCHWLEKYWVERHRTKYYYWRYCWMVDRKIKRCYIGSVNSGIAKRKYADVAFAIEDGDLPEQIRLMIRSYGSNEKEA